MVDNGDLALLPVLVRDRVLMMCYRRFALSSHCPLCFFPLHDAGEKASDGAILLF